MSEVKLRKTKNILTEKEMEQITKTNTHKRQERFSEVMFWIIVSLLVISSIFVVCGWAIFVFCESCWQNQHAVEVLKLVTSTWVGVILAYASKHYLEK